MLEIKHLRMVRAIQEHGTLTGAARALNLSQPAITQQLQALERRMGTPLVERSSSGARLTDAGRVLLRHGATVIDSLALAESEVAAVSGLRAGEVRLAAFPSAASTIVPGAFAALRRRHPGLSVRLIEAEPPEAISLVRSGECDLAVVFNYSTDKPMTVADLLVQPILQEDVHIVMARSHKWAAGPEVDIEELAEEIWIAGCPRCRGHLLAVCAQAGFEPKIAFETDDYVALQSLAANGLGVALVPDLILSVVQVEGLVLRRPRPSSARLVNIVTSDDLRRVPAVDAMIRALRASCGRAVRRVEAVSDTLGVGLPVA